MLRKTVQTFYEEVLGKHSGNFNEKKIMLNACGYAMCGEGIYMFKHSVCV